MDEVRLRIAARWPGSAAALIAGIAVLASLVLGFLAVRAPVIAFLIPLLGLAIVTPTVSPCHWAAAAVVTAVFSRALVALGLLPASASYLDLPLAFAAFALAALTARSWSRTAGWVVLGLGGLAVGIVSSGILAGSSPVQWLLSYALLGAPFAVVAAILLAPPPPDLRRGLIITAMALAFIQIPISVVQATQASHPDEVQGTFVGSAAGAHLAGGIAVVAAVWLLGRARTVPQALGAAPLLLVPFLANATQMLLAMFAALILSPLGGRLTVRMRAVGVIGSVVVIGAVYLGATQYSRTVGDALLHGERGKSASLNAVEEELTTSPINFLFGAGPAETVSHSALLTLDPVRDPQSPLAELDLEPSQILLGLGALEEFPSSLAHPASSGLGVVGDLGMVGAAVYVALVAFLLVSAWRLRTPDRAGATTALVLFFILGLTFTWWEQSGFTLYVALLVGLALARA